MFSVKMWEENDDQICSILAINLFFLVRWQLSSISAIISFFTNKLIFPSKVTHMFYLSDYFFSAINLFFLGSWQLCFKWWFFFQRWTYFSMFYFRMKFLISEHPSWLVSLFFSAIDMFQTSYSNVHFSQARCRIQKNRFHKHNSPPIHS